jgi:high affinity sulfate transporter 1
MASSRSPLMLVPYRWLPGLGALVAYDRRWLPRDLAAGLSVAAIALPVGIAYAELAGVPAVIGIYSAIFPPLAYALFGSSRQLMVGPDAATCIMVAASLGPLAGGDPQRFVALVPMLALMTGGLYLVAGLCRLGFIASFLSQPILTGYLNGIAALIIVGQLPKLLGYPGAAQEFVPRLLELFERLDQPHLPTLGLGLASIVALLVLRRLAPAVPGALAVVAGGVAAVAAFGLPRHGVAVIGTVPAGLPQLHFVSLDAATFRSLLQDAAGIVLISFTSGVLTAKSFARRNGYEIDANQELIAFGASNLAAGLAQGFAVTGADSRTAVNDAMGGKTQLVGVAAAAAMLLVLIALARPLSLVPTAALAAVILVAAVGLFDLDGLCELFRMSPREGLLSVGTTVGVPVLGVLPGIVLAIALSLTWLLALASRPTDAVLGRVPGLKGFHSIADYREAQTVAGLLLYRFNGNLLFFNVDYFCARLRRAIQRSEGPVAWVVVDASSINLVDATAAQRVAELRAALAAQGIELAVARAKRQLRRYFDPRWVERRGGPFAGARFPTLKSAVRAFDDAQAAGLLRPAQPGGTADRAALRQAAGGRPTGAGVDPAAANGDSPEKDDRR